jgi:hypothetical protein
MVSFGFAEILAFWVAGVLVRHPAGCGAGRQRPRGGPAGQSSAAS